MLQPCRLFRGQSDFQNSVTQQRNVNTGAVLQIVDEFGVPIPGFYAEGMRPPRGTFDTRSKYASRSQRGLSRLTFRYDRNGPPTSRERVRAAETDKSSTYNDRSGRCSAPR